MSGPEQIQFPNGESNGNCEQIRELLHDFHDAELSAKEHDSVQGHLDGCAACRSSLAEIQSLAALLKSLPRQEMTRDFADVLADRIDTGDDRGKVLQFKASPVLIGVAAAACLMVLAFSIPHLSNTDSGNTPQVANSGGEVQPIEPFTGGVAVTRVDDRADRSSERLTEAADEDGSSSVPVIKALPEKVAEVKKPESELTKVPAKVTAKIEEKAPDMVALRPGDSAPVEQQKEQVQLLANEAVVAFDGDEPDNLFSQMGVGTDEDGLYAIKL